MNTQHEIIICSNNETIAHQCGHYGDDNDDIGDAYFDAAVDCLNRDIPENCTWEAGQSFRDWNGGKYADQCGKTIGTDTFGYSSGLVATLSKNPPDWLKKLCDDTHDAGMRAAEAAVEQVTNGEPA